MSGGTVFDNTAYKDMPEMEDAKHWITGDLQRPLSDVRQIRFDCPPIEVGFPGDGIRHCVPGSMIHITITFKGEKHPYYYPKVICLGKVQQEEGDKDDDEQE